MIIGKILDCHKIGWLAKKANTDNSNYIDTCSLASGKRSGQFFRVQIKITFFNFGKRPCRNCGAAAFAEFVSQTDFAEMMIEFCRNCVANGSVEAMQDKEK